MRPFEKCTTETESTKRGANADLKIGDMTIVLLGQSNFCRAGHLARRGATDKDPALAVLSIFENAAEFLLSSPKGITGPSVDPDLLDGLVPRVERRGVTLIYFDDWHDLSLLYGSASATSRRTPATR